MGKLKDKIKSSFGFVKTLGKTHPVTFTVLIICTACFTLLGFFEGFLQHAKSIRSFVDDGTDILLHLGLWTIMILAAVFLMENTVKKGRILLKTVIVVVTSAVTYFFSAIITPPCYCEDFFKDLGHKIGSDRLAMITMGYFAILGVLSVYFCYRKLSDEFSFAEYLMGGISGGFLIGVIYTVVMIGAVTLTFVFTELLFGNFEDIFLPLCAIITGFYLGGASISVVVHSEKEVPKFVNILFRYVLFGMGLAAYIIVYLYIFKIVFLSKFPSNSVYSILTALFCSTIPIAYLNSYMEEGMIGKISKILPYVFIPLLILQSYTVFVRIGQYGLTPSRYAGVIFILFEMVYIIWYAIERDRLVHILVLISAVAFILTMLPGVNILAVPREVQNSTFKKLISMDIDDLSDRQIDHLVAAYDYLSDMEGGKDFLKERYTDEEIETAKDLLRIGKGNQKQYESSNYMCRSVDIDVEDYEKISSFEYSESRSDDGMRIKDCKDLPISKTEIGNQYKKDENIVAHFDARDLVTLLESEDYKDNISYYEEDPLVFEADGLCFVITKANINYDEESGNISYLKFSGFILR
ncbi:MAG: DUF4153 domain-containing protein [Lachnospiraceae bacterium]|nr:DUF4153 domain-containing protein [Lachnospiraceae bacterium]